MVILLPVPRQVSIVRFPGRFLRRLDHADRALSSVYVPRYLPILIFLTVASPKPDTRSPKPSNSRPSSWYLNSRRSTIDNNPTSTEKNDRRSYTKWNIRSTFVVGWSATVGATTDV